jgi:hypothetical protein
MDGHQG